MGTLANMFLSATTYAPYGNIYTSSIVTFYCTWLLYTALAADHDPKCNTLLSDGKQQKGGAVMWIGIALVTAALSYLGYKTTTVFLDSEEAESLKQDDEEAREAEAPKENKEVREDQEKFNMKKANIPFHLIMVCGSFYM